MFSPGSVFGSWRFHSSPPSLVNRMTPTEPMPYGNSSRPTTQPISGVRKCTDRNDERNPVELGIVAREIKRVKNGAYYQIPASAETSGHGTSGNAKWWKHLLAELLSDAKSGQ